MRQLRILFLEQLAQPPRRVLQCPDKETELLLLPAALVLGVVMSDGTHFKYNHDLLPTWSSAVPDAALSNRKIGGVSNHGRAALFYDVNPPAGYHESYYVTIKGVVGHVPIAALPALLAAADKIHH